MRHGKMPNSRYSSPFARNRTGCVCPLRLMDCCPVGGVKGKSRCSWVGEYGDRKSANTAQNESADNNKMPQIRLRLALFLRCIMTHSLRFCALYAGPWPPATDQPANYRRPIESRYKSNIPSARKDRGPGEN